MSKTIIKAYTDKAGTTIGTDQLQIANNIFRKKTNDSSYNIPSGYSAVNEEMVVKAGTTVTVETDANLTVQDSLTVEDTGDLVIDGEVTIDDPSDGILPSVTTSEIKGTPNFSAGLILDPTNLDNATATKLGLKRYYQGTHWNFSGAFGGSMSIGYITPKQLQDGSWVADMVFHLTGLNSSTSDDLRITGVDFSIEGDSGKRQYIWHYRGVSASQFAHTFPAGAGVDSIRINKDTGTTVVDIQANNVILNSKPTWAY